MLKLFQQFSTEAVEQYFKFLAAERKKAGFIPAQ